MANETTETKERIHVSLYLTRPELQALDKLCEQAIEKFGYKARGKNTGISRSALISKWITDNAETETN